MADRDDAAREAIATFFLGYRDAYNGFDIAGIVRHIAVPSLFIERDCRVWTTREDLRGDIERLVAHYRDNGFKAADFVIERLMSQGPENAVVDVGWTIERQGGRVPWRFRTGYNLHRFVDGWRIVACTAYDEPQARRESS